MDYIDKLIKEAEYYDSINKFKLADRIYDNLVKIAREAKWSDWSGGEGLKSTIYVEYFNKFISMNPQCACLNQQQGPLIMQGLADAALQNTVGDIFDKIGQMDTSCSQQVLMDCVSKMRGYVAPTNPMNSPQAQQVQQKLNN